MRNGLDPLNVFMLLVAAFAFGVAAGANNAGEIPAWAFPVAGVVLSILITFALNFVRRAEQGAEEDLEKAKATADPNDDIAAAAKLAAWQAAITALELAAKTGDPAHILEALEHAHALRPPAPAQRKPG